MKGILYFILILASPALSEAQDSDLLGSWRIIELKYITDQGIEKVLEQEINAGTATTEFCFMDMGKFRQRSNMGGNDELETHEGTWTTSGNRLIISLVVMGRSIEIEYTMEKREGTLILTRTNPQGTFSIVNVFTRK